MKSLPASSEVHSEPFGATSLRKPGAGVLGLTNLCLAAEPPAGFERSMVAMISDLLCLLLMVVWLLLLYLGLYPRLQPLEPEVPRGAALLFLDIGLQAHHQAYQGHVDHGW